MTVYVSRNGSEKQQNVFTIAIEYNRYLSCVVSFTSSGKRKNKMYVYNEYKSDNLFSRKTSESADCSSIRYTTIYLYIIKKNIYARIIGKGKNILRRAKNRTGKKKPKNSASSVYSTITHSDNLYRRKSFKSVVDYTIVVVYYNCHALRSHTC